MESAGRGEQYPSTSNDRRHKSPFLFWLVKILYGFYLASPHGGVQPPAASARPQLQVQEPLRDPGHRDRGELGDGDSLQTSPGMGGANTTGKNTILQGWQCHRAGPRSSKVMRSTRGPYHEDTFKSKVRIINLAIWSPCLDPHPAAKCSSPSLTPPKAAPRGSAPLGAGCCITRCGCHQVWQLPGCFAAMLGGAGWVVGSSRLCLTPHPSAVPARLRIRPALLPREGPASFLRYLYPGRERSCSTEMPSKLSGQEAASLKLKCFNN